MRYIQLSALLVAVGLLAASGCSREAPQTAPASTTNLNPISAEMWVDDVQLASTSAVAAGPDDRFVIGEPLQLSMRIDQAPAGTPVTTYWYGPHNQPVAYETKSTSASEPRLTFTQDNTHYWEAGPYHAEIWIGDEKVEEQPFEIVTG